MSSSGTSLFRNGCITTTARRIWSDLGRQSAPVQGAPDQHRGRRPGNEGSLTALDGSYSEVTFAYVNGSTFVTDRIGGCQCTYRQVNRIRSRRRDRAERLRLNDFVSNSNGSAARPFRQAVTAYRQDPDVRLLRKLQPGADGTIT